MEPELGDIKICRKFSIIPRLVHIGVSGEFQKWIWLQEFFEVYEYEEWNGWWEGISGHWKRTWKLKRQFVTW